eukprot:TRINITY_DN64374_c0_g1_i1.p1 TRINITY_DN64374_c0_g1~~TRINITY_DN64374_c0_g1_i1.p1  ORF type:complete len:717 (-),score=47.30 TRINITY_DN64374_c0_g1_i1:627-2495(-)
MTMMMGSMGIGSPAAVTNNTANGSFFGEMASSSLNRSPTTLHTTTGSDIAAATETSSGLQSPAAGGGGYMAHTQSSYDPLGTWGSSIVSDLMFDETPSNDCGQPYPRVRRRPASTAKRAKIAHRFVKRSADEKEANRVFVAEQKSQLELATAEYYAARLTETKLRSTMAGLRRQALLFPMEVTERQECLVIAMIQSDFVAQLLQARYDHYMDKQHQRVRTNALKSLKRLFGPIVRQHIAKDRLRKITQVLRTVRAEEAEGGKEGKAARIVKNFLSVIGGWIWKAKVLIALKKFFRHVRLAQRIARTYSQTRKWQVFLLCRRWDVVVNKLRTNLQMKLKEQGNPKLSKLALSKVSGEAATYLMVKLTAKQEAFDRDLLNGLQPNGPEATKRQKRQEAERKAMLARNQNSLQSRLKKKHNISPFLSAWFEKNDDLASGLQRKKRRAVEIELDDDDDSEDLYVIPLKEKKRVIYSDIVHRFHQHVADYREWTHRNTVMSMTASVMGKSVGEFAKQTSKVLLAGGMVKSSFITEVPSSPSTPAEKPPPPYGSTGSSQSFSHGDARKEKGKKPTKFRRFKWLLTEMEMLTLICKYFRVPLEMSESPRPPPTPTKSRTVRVSSAPPTR